MINKYIYLESQHFNFFSECEQDLQVCLQEKVSWLTKYLQQINWKAKYKYALCFYIHNANELCQNFDCKASSLMSTAQ